MSGRLVRSGLLLPAAAVWLVALVGVAAPAAAPVGIVASLVAAAAVLATRLRTRGAALLVVGALLAALVLAAVAAGDARRHPPELPLGRPVVATVRIDERSATTGASAAGALRARTMLRGAVTRVAAHDVDVPVLLFADGAGAAVRPGASVRARVVLRPAAPTDGAAAIGSVLGPVRVVRSPPPLQLAATALRAGLVERTSALPGDGAALLPGLAVGDTGRVGADLEQAMRDSSLTHLTAVSGANCAVVTVAVFALAGLLRLPRTARVVLAGAALAGFVVLVTPQPSVQRAAAMAAVALLCALRGGRAAGVPALAVAVLALLLVDPWLAWSPGFVLSAAATAGLLLLAPPLAERLGRVLPRRLALVLAVPVAAQAACQPVLVLLQPGVPVFGVVANLLAEPAAPVATVLGLLACLLGPIAPPLASAAALLAWLPAAWIGLVARTTARLPQLGWPAGALGAALAGALLVAGVLLLARRAPGRVRLLGGVVAAVGLLAVVGGVAGAAVGRLTGTPHDWILAACDVGQGDGLVLNGGHGRFAVVDTGRDAPPITACLDRLGVDRIDLLVLTHWDADHVGAARALAGRVGTAFVGPSDGPEGDALRRDLQRAGAAVQQVHRGETARLDDLRLDVLWPPDPLDGIEPGNPASVTLHVTGRGASALLTGDLGEAAQDALLAAGPVPHVDVVKVAHHGSADQSPALYAAAAAPIGVVSVGAGNDYGHPTRRLLGILRSTGMQPVRTDQDGLVLVARRQGRAVVWTERPVTAAVWTPAE
ncbi:ComEC/Rec2 family competence protein [Amnibacterium setariae]|uniref:ComEC/Rec2 family competence protein n=1 Tax=Amnibacterium setariae TaxID=2306585 RepID=A0A3A1U2W9_9MICO|nr:ComEC/Rec2 family competence protein [Amnibacterium setariae]RIX28197.1 ComEC/Rec2 family competence protein [Amnibacterium setariae]